MSERLNLNLEIEPQKYPLEDLLDRVVVDTKKNIKIIDSTPFFQQLPEEVLPEIIRKITTTNEVYPDVEKFSLKVIKKIQESRGVELDTKSTSSLIFFADAISKVENPEKIGQDSLIMVESLIKEGKEFSKVLGHESEEACKIAASFIGLRLATLLHQAQDEKSPSSTWIIYAYHFAAIQSLLMGIKTNSYPLSNYVEDREFVKGNNIGIAYFVADSDALSQTQMRLLFEGVPVTKVKKTPKGEFYFISGGNI